MMRSRAKMLLCALLAAALVLALLLALNDGPGAVTVLSGEAFSRLRQTQRERAPEERFGTLLIAGETAPFDAESNTYYVPQSMEKTEWDWPLTWSRSGFSAGIAPDALLSDKAEAIGSGHAFLLVVSDGRSYFTQRIVFTGMPMMTLLPHNPHVTENGRYEMRLFDPVGGEDGAYLVSRCFLSFRRRGASSWRYDKKSYRLFLQDAGGKKQQLSLLGCAKDDDWMLLGMYPDPQKIRDKVCCDLWNELCARNPANEPYSDMALTELCIDGEYRGLYTLAKAVGKKSAGLDPNSDYLFQFREWIGNVFVEGEPCTGEQLSQFGEFEQISGNAHIAQAQTASVCAYVDALMRGTAPVTDALLSQLTLSNLVDVSLFVDATSDEDNIQKNAFLSGKRRTDGTYALTLIPWDCDLAFSYAPDADGEGGIGDRVNRIETDRLEQACPARIRPLLQARWAELRQTVFSDAAMQERLRDAFSANVRSGAFARDGARWPDAAHDAALEPVLEDMLLQLAWLDAAYAGMAG